MFNSGTALNVFNALAGSSHSTLESFFQDPASMNALYDSYTLVESMKLLNPTTNPTIFNTAVSVSETVSVVAGAHVAKSLYGGKCYVLRRRCSSNGVSSDLGYRPDGTTKLSTNTASALSRHSGIRD